MCQRPPVKTRSRCERGSSTPLVAMLVLVAGGLCLALGHLGVDAVETAQARTAADAAALAGAAEGEEAARVVAEANGAVLAGGNPVDGAFEARVGVGEAGGVARAVAVLPETGALATGLDPALLAAIAKATALLGQPVPVVSGWRSPAQQVALWMARGSNPFPVAPPGTSAHEQGLAIDVPLSFVPTLLSVAGPAGLCQPLPESDPIHFVLC